MITLKYKQLTNTVFQAAVRKILNEPCSTNQQACHVSKVTKPIADAITAMKDKFNKEVFEKFAERDETGALKKDPHGSLSLDMTKEAEFDKASEAFGETELTIDWRKLSYDDINYVKLSPAEIAAIDGAIFDPLYSDNAEKPMSGVTEIRSKR